MVYVANLSNDAASLVILGRDATSGGTNKQGGVGGDDSGGLDLSAGGLAELLIPFLIRAECGFGNPPLYDQYWDKNIKGACAVYVTNTSDSWSVGLFNWDASRAYTLAYEVASQDSNWKSHFSDHSQAFVTNLSLDVSTGKCRSDNASVVRSGRSSEKSVKEGISSMLSSDIGQEVQRKKARVDGSAYIQTLMDKGVTNPAILIHLSDIWNQYGSRNSLLDAAKNPQTKEVTTYQTNEMMQQFEWYIDRAKENLGSQWDKYTGFGNDSKKSRRDACADYIRELYKQGKLSMFGAGLTQVGEFVVSTHNGLTLAFPYKSRIEEMQDFTVSYNASNAAGTGCSPVSYTIKSVKGHSVTSLFGARWLNGGLSTHTGIDFGTNRGDVYYASHDGTLEIRNSSGGYGYHAIITFKNGNDEWKIYYGHMITGSSTQYGYTTGKTYEVKAGQPIGQGNSTGNSFGHHLHYELRRNGQYVNPLPYLGLGDNHYPILSSMTNFKLD